MSDTLKILILIAIIIVACVIAYKIIKYKIKHKIETITAYTGGLGSGKTLMSVHMAKKIYKKQIRKWKWTNFKIDLRNRFRNTMEDHIEKPLLFSNMPFYINKRKGILTNKITASHLLEQERIPLGSVVMIDELGAFANQFEYTNRNVVVTLDDFIRFFRHYTKGGYLVVNDQCSENINLVVRRRLNIVHNLANCFVLWRFCFYFERMITISEEIKTIDMRSQETDKENDTQNNMVFRFKFLWHKNDYDTYCHSERYKTVPQGNYEEYTELKLYEILKCPRDDNKKHDYIHGKVIDNARVDNTNLQGKEKKD